MRKVLGKLGTALALCAVLTAILWTGLRALDRRFVFWQGSLLPRDAQTLDISGKRAEDLEVLLELDALRMLDARGTGLTAEQFCRLRQEKPACQILWDVPIQGKYYDQNTRALSVSSLTEEEAELLQYLPRLSCVDLGSWQDIEGIVGLVNRYPDCQLLYSVEIGGELWGSDAVSLLIENADAEELLRKLPALPALQSVMLTGNLPDHGELQTLQEAFPQVFFLWKMDALGTTMETDRRELDLTGAQLENLQDLQELLPYFPGLECITFDSCLPLPELAGLVEAYPDTAFTFPLTPGGRSFISTAEELDLSGIPFSAPEEAEALLPCFPHVQKVIMCGCGLSSKEMDALNQRHADIRFVWSVDLGGMPFRTDAVHFTPNRWGLKLTNENIYDLRYCTDMVCVDIGHAVKVTNCDWAAFMPELKYLVLAHTGISDLTPLTGLENLVFLELFLDRRIRDLTPLTTLTNLEDLNLCYIYTDPSPIAEMTWLKRLWWSGCWKAQNLLKDALPDTEMVFSTKSSTGKGWREGRNYYDMRDFIGMPYMTG